MQRRGERQSSCREPHADTGRTCQPNILRPGRPSGDVTVITTAQSWGPEEKIQYVSGENLSKRKKLIVILTKKFMFYIPFVCLSAGLHLIYGFKWNLEEGPDIGQDRTHHFTPDTKNIQPASPRSQLPSPLTGNTNCFRAVSSNREFKTATTGWRCELMVCKYYVGGHQSLWAFHLVWANTDDRLWSWKTWSLWSAVSGGDIFPVWSYQSDQWAEETTVFL